MWNFQVSEGQNLLNEQAGRQEHSGQGRSVFFSTPVYGAYRAAPGIVLDFDVMFHLMKTFSWNIAFCILVLFCGPTTAAPKERVFIVSRPTVVAFFPPVTEAELSNHSDTKEALADFQYYAARVRARTGEVGIDFEEIYASSFSVKCGAKTMVFRPKKTKVGYYFVAPGQSPRIEYGVMTDTDILHIATEYFQIASK